MAENWHYVKGRDRIGPVDKKEIERLYQEGQLDQETYVWTTGYENWKKLKEVAEFSLEEQIPEPPIAFSNEKFSFDNFNKDEKIFTIKIGIDRGGDATEYGPYSMNTLIRFFNESRINAKTMLFTPGMKDWILLGEVPGYEELFSAIPPKIEEKDRRQGERRPFVTRVFFHNQAEVYEAVCRDISVGGMQLMVSNFPGKPGDKVSLNVHPENTAYCFVASGIIVRMLEGGQGFSLRFNRLNSDAQKVISDYLKNV